MCKGHEQHGYCVPALQAHLPFSNGPVKSQCFCKPVAELKLNVEFGQALATLLDSLHVPRLLFSTSNVPFVIIGNVHCGGLRAQLTKKAQWPLRKQQSLMPSKCPMQCAIASYNSLDLALRAHLHSGSMTIAAVAKIHPDPQVQRKCANLTKSLQRQIHKHQQSDEGDRRYAREL